MWPDKHPNKKSPTKSVLTDDTFKSNKKYPGNIQERMDKLEKKINVLMEKIDVCYDQREEKYFHFDEGLEVLKKVEQLIDKVNYYVNAQKVNNKGWKPTSKTFAVSAQTEEIGKDQRDRVENEWSDGIQKI